MTTDPATEYALAALQARLDRGVRATPLCLAVMGWLCRKRTVPFIADIRLAADGQVWLRLSDETAAAPICSFLEFLDQVRIICQSIPMTDSETRQLVALAQHLLS